VDNGMTIAVIVGLLTVALGVLLIALRAGVDREAVVPCSISVDYGLHSTKQSAPSSAISPIVASVMTFHGWYCCMMVMRQYVRPLSAADYRMFWRVNLSYRRKPGCIGICSIGAW
jgi:hypothetical protein